MHKKLGDKKKRKQKKMLDNNYFVFDAYAKTAIISHANKGHFSRIEEAKKKKGRHEKYEKLFCVFDWYLTRLHNSILSFPLNR